MKRILLLIATMIVLSGCHGASDSGTAYFKVAGATEADTFVIALTDPATIAEARALWRADRRP